MFYRPEDGHGLDHDPFGAIVAPRPIGWIATRGRDGQDNLAPYSFFNAVAYQPPQVMFASTSAKPDRVDTKDSMANLRDTGVFCVHLVDHPLAQAMNETSASLPRGVDEFAKVGLARVDCDTIACARLPDAPAALECRLTRIIRLEGAHNFVAFGRVTGVHIRPDCLRDGRVDLTARGLLARLGYRDYATIDKGFEMARPDGG